MKYLSIIIISFFILAGCTKRAATPTQTTSASQSAYEGMTKQEILSKLGRPTLDNRLDSNKWDYVFTSRLGERTTVRRMSLYFQDNKVVRVQESSTDSFARPSPSSLERAYRVPKGK